MFKKSDLIKNSGNTITDAASMLSFKLAQHGIESFPASFPEIPLKFHDNYEERVFSRKSYRTYQSKTLSKEAFEKLLQESFSTTKSSRTKKEKSTTLLGRLLNELRAFPYSDAKLLKYRYASAGSLHPVVPAEPSSVAEISTRERCSWRGLRHYSNTATRRRIRPKKLRAPSLERIPGLFREWRPRTCVAPFDDAPRTWNSNRREEGWGMP